MRHRIALPDWAIERGRVLNHIDRLEPARTALVVIDMQRVFLAENEVFGNPYALALVPVVNRLAAAFRSAGARVIWTRQTVDHTSPRSMPSWQYDLSVPEVARAVAVMIAGTASHALHADVATAPEDRVIDKFRYGAFFCPDRAIERVLREQAADTLVIAGTLTNCCCDSTAREANMRGYRVLFLSDATAARTDAEQNAALLTVRLNFADVATADRAIELISLSARLPIADDRA